MRTIIPIEFFLLLVLGFFASSATAQPIANHWKPDVGDRFVCGLSHVYNCGDWKCGGDDTLEFTVTDTAYNGYSQYPNAVFVATSLLAPHLTLYSWGARGQWDSVEVEHSYNDTTLLQSSGHQIRVLFNGYNLQGRMWSTIPLQSDSSVVFQGTMYSAWYGSNSLFLPTLGWFFSLNGDQWPGACADYCVDEPWHLYLIAAYKHYNAVLPSKAQETSVSFEGGLLVLSNVHSGEVQLLDLLGRTMQSWRIPQDWSAGSLSLNVSDVPSGVYFVQLRVDGIDDIKRIAIVH